MAPKCTGNPEQSGVWTCPFCQPCKKEKECFSIVDTPGGPAKVPCGPPCTLAPFHARSPGELWEHFKEVHGWEGDLSDMPPRLLDNAVPVPQPSGKVSLPVTRGPSKAKRDKARAKRKKKKRRR